MQNANNLLLDANTKDKTIIAVCTPTSLGGGNSGRIFDSNGGNVVCLTTVNKLETTLDYFTTTPLSAALTFSKTFMFAITRTTSGIENIYVNGALSGTANQTGSWNSVNTTSYLLNRAAGDRVFAGYFQEFIVINQILTANQLMDFYKNFYNLV